MENVSQNKKKKKNENRLKYLSKTFSFKCEYESAYGSLKRGNFDILSNKSFSKMEAYIYIYSNFLLFVPFSNLKSHKRYSESCITVQLYMLDNHRHHWKVSLNHQIFFSYPREDRKKISLIVSY